MGGSGVLLALAFIVGAAIRVVETISGIRSYIKKKYDKTEKNHDEENKEEEQPS